MGYVKLAEWLEHAQEIWAMRKGKRQHTDALSWLDLPKEA